MARPFRPTLSASVIALSLLGADAVHAGCGSSPGPGTDWSGCRKMSKVLQDYDLTGAKFVRADLSRSNFQKATLVDADFTKSNLSYTILRRANLANAKLSGAFGTRTYMREASLKGADLSKAEFFRAKLTAADSKQRQP